MSSQERWYTDPARGGLTTIRQAKEIHDYPTPEEVKAMMSGPVIEDASCPLCGGPLPEDGGNEHEQ